MLAGTVADHQRAAEPRADDAIGVHPIDDADRIGAFQPPHRVLHGIEEPQSPLRVFINKLGDDLRIRIRVELVAFRLESAAKRLVIFDDAVMHHGNPFADDMGMGVTLIGDTVGRPPRVRDSDATLQRRVLQKPF